MNEVYEVVVKVLAAFLLTGVLSFVLTPYVKRLAHRIGAIDVPKDARRMHKKTDSPPGRSGDLSGICCSEFDFRRKKYTEFDDFARFCHHRGAGHF